MNAYTIVISPESGAPRVLRLTSELVAIGRSACDLPIDDVMVSARHAELHFRDGYLLFKDVGSTNGSYTEDGHRIHDRYDLLEGSAVRLGNTVIRVQSIEAGDSGDKTVVDPNFRWSEDMEERARASLEQRGGEPAGAAGAGGRASNEPYTPPGGGREADGRQGSGAPAGASATSGSGGGGGGGGLAGRLSGLGGGGPVHDAPFNPPVGAAAANVNVPISDTFDFAVIIELWKAAINAMIGLFQGNRGTEGNASGAPAPMDAVMFAWKRVEARLTEAPIIIGVVTVPMGVLWGLVSFVPSLAGIVGLVSSLVGIAQMFAYAAAVKYFFAIERGQPIGWQQAWKEAIAEPVPLFVSLLVAGLVSLIGFIALIIPGIFLAAFILPVYFAEGRRMIGLNARSVQLVAHAPVRVIVAMLIVGAASFGVQFVVGMVFGFIPAVGGLLGALVGAVVAAVFGALSAALMVHLYLDLGARYEGVAPKDRLG